MARPDPPRAPVGPRLPRVGQARRRGPLGRGPIVEAALALIEEDGLAAFSLRALGAALGCEPMSLYHYFPSKAHLLDAVVDHVIGQLAIRPPGVDPLAELSGTIHSYRALAHRYPKLFQLLA